VGVYVGLIGIYSIGVGLIHRGMGVGVGTGVGVGMGVGMGMGMGVGVGVGLIRRCNIERDGLVFLPYEVYFGRTVVGLKEGPHV
jgi:outer membrane usher protein